MGLMECTDMAPADRAEYDKVFGTGPVHLCSRHFRAVTRPRLWWCSHQLPTQLPAHMELIDKRGVPELLVHGLREPWSACLQPGWSPCAALAATGARSEERRVGKEGRSRWSPDH